jgi:hypothetical protein
MGDVADIMAIYIQDSDILEEKAEEISHSLEENIKNYIAPGMVGYDTGHLHDTITSVTSVSDDLAIIAAFYQADYGQYWERWKGGVDFMNEGLEETLLLYG